MVESNELLIKNQLEINTEVDNEDGIQDIIIAVATKLLKLLRGNIESLKPPEVLIIVFKKLKDLAFFPDAHTKMISRIVSNQRQRQIYQQQQWMATQAAAEAPQ